MLHSPRTHILAFTLLRVEYRSNLCSTLHETWIITLILLSYNHVSPGSLTRGQGSRPPGLGTADAHRRHSNISLTINTQIHDSQSSSHHSKQTLQCMLLLLKKTKSYEKSRSVAEHRLRCGIGVKFYCRAPYDSYSERSYACVR